MKHFVTILTVVMVITACGIASATTVNLDPTNNSFEDNTGTPIQSWSHGGAGTASAVDNSGGPSYNYAHSGNNVASVSGFGNYSTSTLTSGTVWTVPSGAVNATFTASAWWMSRTGTGMSIQPYLEVVVNGSVEDSSYPGWHEGWSEWQEISVSNVPVGAGDVVVVKLGAQADGNGNSHTMWWDDVHAQGSYVPEPATIGFLVLGFGLVCRRRK